MPRLIKNPELRFVLAISLFGLIVACSTVAFMLTSTSVPLESPKILIRGVPLYSGAYGTVWSDSSQPNFTAGNPGWPGYDEAASLSFQVGAAPNLVEGYYGSWFANNGWVPWNYSGGWYETGQENFAGFQFVSDSPFFGIGIRRDRQSNYRVNIEATPVKSGITDVRVTLYRLGVSASAKQTALAAPVPTAMPTLSGTILPYAVTTMLPSVPAQP